MYSDSHQTLITTLPEHLIIDNILPRIPAKSLIRFKIVCKSWLSVISSIDFAKSHLKFSSLCPQFAVLNRDFNLSITHKLYLLPSDDDDNNRNESELVTLDLDPNLISVSLKLVGGSNGLLCFYLVDYSNDNSGHFCVWNPLTRKCRKIMCPDGEHIAASYGFSYASSIDDYKIVAKCCRKSDRYKEIRSFYFSLRSSEWKMITGIDITTTINHSNTLFYTAKGLDCRQEYNKCIVGFDLVDEKVKEIPFMNWISRYKWVKLLAIKECVSLLCYDDPRSDVWVLKQYGDWNSWEKMYSFNIGRMDSVNIIETGKWLVVSYDDSSPVDSSSVQVKVISPSEDNPDDSRVGIDVSGHTVGTGVYVESLISPFQGMDGLVGIEH